jgi:hypothetical protein
MAQDVVVTGTLVRSPQLEVQRRSEAKAGDVSKAQAEPFRAFLSRLQAVVRADDQSAIIALINLPLRVEGAGGPHIYRDEQSVGQSFDRIFTPRVTRAILRQKPGKLVVRNRRAVVGGGELWLAETCPDVACSTPGPVRIEAVNP